MDTDPSLFEVRLQRLKDGQEDAARAIWNDYFPHVVRLAGRRLAGQRRQAADEEDVAISVMESFLRATRAGRFPQLRDRDGIWRLLARMTSRKAIDLIRKNAARPLVGESALAEGSVDARPLGAVIGRDATPAVLALVADEIERCLEILPDKYRLVAQMKLECLTVPEIAEHCGIHASTVERRLRIIRGYWQQAMSRDDE